MWTCYHSNIKVYFLNISQYFHAFWACIMVIMWNKKHMNIKQTDKWINTNKTTKLLKQNKKANLNYHIFFIYNMNNTKITVTKSKHF